jgi:hypothetical protein
VPLLAGHRPKGGPAVFFLIGPCCRTIRSVSNLNIKRFDDWPQGFA